MVQAWDTSLQCKARACQLEAFSIRALPDISVPQKQSGGASWMCLRCYHHRQSRHVALPSRLVSVVLVPAPVGAMPGVNVPQKQSVDALWICRRCHHRRRSRHRWRDRPRCATRTQSLGWLCSTAFPTASCFPVGGRASSRPGADKLPLCAPTAPAVSSWRCLCLVTPRRSGVKISLSPTVNDIEQSGAHGPQREQETTTSAAAAASLGVMMFPFLQDMALLLVLQ